MTDNPNIIDGIDVSMCEWFGQIDLDINIICTSNSPKKCSGYCKDNPNCVYKQLKHKEQKLKQIEKLCIKNSTKSSFCNGIENKDMQKLAIRILQIVSEVK